MQTVGNTQYTLIPPTILQQLCETNNKGEPLKCPYDVVNNSPMITHSFDYSEIIEFYNWRWYKWEWDCALIKDTQQTLIYFLNYV